MCIPGIRQDFVSRLSVPKNKSWETKCHSIQYIIGNSVDLSLSILISASFNLPWTLSVHVKHNIRFLFWQEKVSMIEAYNRSLWSSMTWLSSLVTSALQLKYQSFEQVSTCFYCQFYFLEVAADMSAYSFHWNSALSFRVNFLYA